MDRSAKAPLSTYNTSIQLSRLQKIYHFQSLKSRLATKPLTVREGNCFVISLQITHKHIDYGRFANDICCLYPAMTEDLGADSMDSQDLGPWPQPQLGPSAKVNLRTKILDFRGFDSNIIFNFEALNSHVHGKFPGKFESTKVIGASRDNLSREIGHV